MDRLIQNKRCDIVKELPIRKPNRLNHYDYSQSGYYFITVCIKDRHELLGSIDVGANCVRPCLSEYGRIVEKEIAILSETYNAVSVRNYVIMPNHIHLIVVIGESGRTQFAPTISRIIKQFKGSITKKVGFSIWQRSFHDRIIRNKDEYSRIAEYIENNPYSWQDDCFYPN
jgi:REP element-mobilizing transposase RayT